MSLNDLPQSPSPNMPQDLANNTNEHKFKFHGDGGDYFGIWIANILLTIITLGIYSAWAKVRTKKYFYGNTELDGDRFEYLATPIQILVGRIIAVIALIIWSVLTNINPTIAIASGICLGVALPYLMVRNLRFDARVTRYRNVRFNFEGNVADAYINILFKPLLAYALVILPCVGLFQLSETYDNPYLIGLAVIYAPVTIVLAYAWVMSNMARYIVNGYRYGKKVFSAEVNWLKYVKIALGAAGIFLGLLFSSFIATLVLGAGNIIVELISNGSLPSTDDGSSAVAISIFIGYLMMFISGFLMSAFIKVKVRNYLFGQMELDEQLKFRSNMKVMGFFKLMLTNILIMIFSLGWGRAWVDVRTARYYADCTQVSGDLTLITAQDHQDDSNAAIADEMVDAFDLNINVI